MAVRRSSPREERRRRVLVEERHAQGSSPTPTEGVPRTRTGATARYTSAARAEQQPRTIDFLPKRLWTLSIWFLVGLCVVVSHATLYTGYLHWHAPEQQVDLSAWDLSGPQNLLRWTSSCLLLASALLALQILQLRRHRIDDYRARYRLWYYVIAILLLGSMDSVAGLHRIIESGAQHIVSRSTLPLPASSVIWMLLAVGMVLVVSVLLEIRASRGAAFCVAFAGIAYVASGVLRQAELKLLSDPLLTIAEALTLLTGHYLLLMSLVVYGRHVHLDAQGRLSRPAVRRRIPAQRLWSALPFRRKPGSSVAEPAAAPTAEASKAKRSAPEQNQDSEGVPASGRSNEAKRPAATRESDDEADDGADDGPSTLPLSRAERKRLRKQQKRDRRAA